jgi:hypothetical protein
LLSSQRQTNGFSLAGTPTRSEASTLIEVSEVINFLDAIRSATNCHAGAAGNSRLSLGDPN